MTRDEVRKILDTVPAMQGFVDGSEVQYLCGDGKWCTSHTPNFHPDYKWRLKPEPAYRSFTDFELQCHAIRGTRFRNKSDGSIDSLRWSEGTACIRQTRYTSGQLLANYEIVTTDGASILAEPAGVLEESR